MSNGKSATLVMKSGEVEDQGGEDNNNANQFIVRMPNVLHADQSFYPDSISSLNSNTILSSKIYSSDKACVIFATS